MLVPLKHSLAILHPRNSYWHVIDYLVMGDVYPARCRGVRLAGHGAYCGRAESGTTDRLNAYFEQAYRAGKMNGNVLIADHGKVIFRGAFGYADGSRKIPLTLSDRFDIGSISKEFDAVGIMILAQEGKLKSSDPVSKFVPGLQPWADAVTVDQLMHYTSGLPDIDWNTVTTDEDALRNLRALKKLDFPCRHTLRLWQ